MVDGKGLRYGTAWGASMGKKKQRYPNGVLRQGRGEGFRAPHDHSVGAVSAPKTTAIPDESCQKSDEEQLKALIMLANQVFDLERKVGRLEPADPFRRIVMKMKESLAIASIEYADPAGEPFDETRADCEGHIAGVSVENLVIVEVIKPIVRFRNGDHVRQLQRAVVVVQSRKREE